MLAALPLSKFMFIFGILLFDDPSVNDFFCFDFLSFNLHRILDAPQIAHVDSDFGESDSTAAEHTQGHSLRDAPVTGSDPYGDATSDDGDEDVDDECKLAIDIGVGHFIFFVFYSYASWLGNGCSRVDQTLVCNVFFLSAKTGHQGGILGSLFTDVSNEQLRREARLGGCIQAGVSVSEGAHRYLPP